MHIMKTITILLSGWLLSIHAYSQELPGLPPQERILEHLRAKRPRVLATDDDFARVKRLIESDERAKQWYAAIRARGEAMIKQPPTAYNIPDGLRLLRQSRNTLERAVTLGLLYRIDGDDKYRDRIWQDMDAAAAFEDWNPRHFLDVGEMTCAFAVAYDWLYDAWTAEQRMTIRGAITKHGLETALRAYRAEKPPWWTRSENNWNQVCNGGIAIGAIALADERPELAAEVLHQALANLPPAVASFAPDGACVEGTGYWAYATRYYVYLLSTLDSALGRDFGLSELPAVDRLGDFPVMLCGPNDRTFNFADCSEHTPNDAALTWLAQRFQRPNWAHYQAERSAGHALDLLWYRPGLFAKPPGDLPLDAHFRHIDAIVMRSAWNDPGAWFLGCKAGDNRFNHGNLDIGSFVLDALGQRWVEDLGRDDYNMPGYFSGRRGGKRWTYYRMRAEAHNTLVIRPGAYEDQDPTAAGRVLQYVSTPTRVTAVIDMTPAYAEWANRTQRSFVFERPTDAGPSVTVRDEIELRAPEEVYWFAHTRAKVNMSDDGRRADLSLNGKSLNATLDEPPGAKFTLLDAAPLPGAPNPDGQASNEPVKRLAVHLPGTSATTIQVTFAEPENTAVSGNADGAKQTFPLLYEQSFGDDAALHDFAFSDANAWRIAHVDGDPCLDLHAASTYTPPHRSPRNIAILKTPVVGSFVLKAKVMQTGREYTHRDMCVFFGVRDATHYYYAHIASAADDASHQIHIVDGADRRPITTTRTQGVDWGKDQWHQVRVVRDARSGEIAVYFDDSPEPILTATDSKFASGYVGLGSFDDVGRIDDVRLWAEADNRREFPGFPAPATQSSRE